MIEPSELQPHLRAPFSDAQVEALWRGVASRRERTSQRRWLLLAVPLAAAAALLVLARPAPRAPRPEASRGPLRLASGAALDPSALRVQGTTPRRVVLDDRSTLTLHPGVALSTAVNNAREVSLTLRLGAADFEVTPRGPRRWRIHCGLATITVVGTAFSLERSDARLRVAVSHGTVWVDGAAVPGGHRVLLAGQSLTVHAPSAPTQQAPPSPRPATAVAARVPRVAAVRGWQLQARRGDVEGAWNALGHNGFARESASATSPAALLELADLARRSRHHDLAAPLLERFVRENPDHPEAAMAAFTLGRDELSWRRRPAEAARWFQRALTLHPPRLLDEDVRARLVEARLAAGERAAACEDARAYLAAHPSGRHAERIANACETP